MRQERGADQGNAFSSRFLFSTGTNLKHNNTFAGERSRCCRRLGRRQCRSGSDKRCHPERNSDRRTRHHRRYQRGRSTRKFNDKQSNWCRGWRRAVRVDFRKRRSSTRKRNDQQSNWCHSSWRLCVSLDFRKRRSRRRRDCGISAAGELVAAAVVGVNIRTCEYLHSDGY